jgi:hypothetical protein
MSNTARSRTALGIAFQTLGLIAIAFFTAPSSNALATPQRPGSQARQIARAAPLTATTVGAPTRALQLVDVNGKFVAPVLDCVDSVGIIAHAIFDVEGHVAVVQARADAFQGRADNFVFYESADCSGTAYIQNNDIVVFSLDGGHGPSRRTNVTRCRRTSRACVTDDPFSARKQRR